MQMLVHRHLARRRQQPDGHRGGRRHRRHGSKQSPHVADVTSAWTVPAGRRRRTDQQGRQVRPDRRRHHRRRERRPEVRQGAVRRRRPRPRRRHRALRRHRDGLRADQRADRTRPAADGVDRDPAELPGAGVGVRRAGRRGAARWSSAAWRSSGRCRCCGSSRFSTDVSIFALNLSTAMGLALAIDYTLLIISRYRDELADGVPRDEALIRTMSTAGRTVLFSATTVALSMAAMLLFPMYFLKSFAYAGVATVALRRRRRGDRHARGDLAARRPARRARRPPPAAPADPPARARRQARRAAVLVPLDQGRHAPRGPDRAGRRRAAAGARRAVPRRQVGLPRRPGAARRRRRHTRSATNCATTSPTTRRPRSPSSCPTPTG